MKAEKSLIQSVMAQIRRQPPKVKAFLAVVTAMMVLVLLRVIVHEHDNLFVASEAVHALGIGVLIYKLTKEKTCAEVDSPFKVKLCYSFQDDEHLYLIMEYLPGGDLMTLLMRKDTLREDETRFYVAQTILAIESIHKHNYVHGDIKPDNLLITRYDHIKLSEFGLSKSLDSKNFPDFKAECDDRNTSIYSSSIYKLGFLDLYPL